MIDGYLDWEALEEQSGSATTSNSTFEFLSVKRGRGDKLRELLAMDGVPEDVKAVVRERLVLEERVNALTSGHAVTEFDDERTARRFEVPVHTKATRLREKRWNRIEERRSLALKRAQEKAKIAQAEEARRNSERQLVLAGSVKRQQQAKLHAARRDEERKDQLNERIRKLVATQRIEERRTSALELARQEVLRKVKDAERLAWQKSELNQVLRLRKRLEDNQRRLRFDALEAANRRELSDKGIARFQTKQRDDMRDQSRRERATANYLARVKSESNWADARDRLDAR